MKIGRLAVVGYLSLAGLHSPAFAETNGYTADGAQSEEILRMLSDVNGNTSGREAAQSVEALRSIPRVYNIERAGQTEQMENAFDSLSNIDGDSSEEDQNQAIEDLEAAAYSADNGAGDLCGSVMCLSVSGAVPHQCAGHVDKYFSIRVYSGRKKRFNPPATAVKRYARVLSQCQDVPQVFKDAVNAMYGPLKDFPFGYY